MDITRKINLLAFFFLSTCSMVFSQEEADTLIFYYDQVYANNIKTVQFHRAGDPSTLPVMTMDGTQRLYLSFDDLDADYKRYTYTVIHCNRDWSPSEELVIADYLENFEFEEIRDFNSSMGTYQPYTRYELYLPNKHFNWTLSGNYVLQVFDENQRLVMTKRFVSVQRRVPIASFQEYASRVQISRTHQELQFYSDLKEIYLDEPMQSVEATIIQNTNWNTSMELIPPRRIMGDRLMFDYPNRIIFPAGKPYRIADLRSARSRSAGVYAIETYDNVIWVTMETDRKRLRTKSIDDFDIDGSFVIANVDQNGAELRSEYLNVMFTLESAAPFFDKEVPHRCPS